MPSACRNYFRHQRHAHGELSAHAQSGQESQNVELREVGGEEGQSGEYRVEQNRRRHRLDAAPAVAEDAEHDPADRPPDHENHGRVAGLL